MAVLLRIICCYSSGMSFSEFTQYPSFHSLQALPVTWRLYDHSQAFVWFHFTLLLLFFFALLYNKLSIKVFFQLSGYIAYVYFFFSLISLLKISEKRKMNLKIILYQWYFNQKKLDEFQIFAKLWFSGFSDPFQNCFTFFRFLNILLSRRGL